MMANVGRRSTGKDRRKLKCEYCGRFRRSVFTNQRWPARRGLCDECFGMGVRLATVYN